MMTREQRLTDELYTGDLRDGISPTVEAFAEWLYENYGWNMQQARDFGFEIAFDDNRHN
jgi:hypothetical protein